MLHLNLDKILRIKQKVGKSFIKNAIQSVEYVMDNKDRYALMGLIVKFLMTDRLLKKISHKNIVMS